MNTNAVRAVIVSTTAMVCVGGVLGASPAAATQHTEGCGGTSSHVLGIDEIVTQRKARMVADYLGFAAERAAFDAASN